MTRLPKTVAEYYSAQVSPHKETLLEMRERILEVIPGAEEIIKYGMPTFVYNGSAVAGLMANKKHVGYYPYSGSVIEQIPEITKSFKVTKGSIHLPIDKPLSKVLIKRLILTRIKNVDNSK